MSNFEGMYIRQLEDKYAPPAMDVLGVNVVGNTTFLEIGKLEETYADRNFTMERFVAVPTEDLYAVITILRESARRAAQKDD